MSGTLAQWLIILGSSIFGMLGFLHFLITFLTPAFEAYDPQVTEAMKSSSPKLTKETTIWRAWVGFNASHSFGAILFPLVYIPLSLNHFELIQHSLWFSCLPVVVGIGYLILAKCYWFKIPLLGISLATAGFTLAAVLIHV